MSHLSEILPKARPRLIDLVKAAGVDVVDWGNFTGGEERAASNPKYCYEWSFVQPDKVVVLNLWHEYMEEDEHGIVFDRLNLREIPRGLSWPRVARAQAFCDAIKVAYAGKLPIRVIVLTRKGDESSSRKDVSRATGRLLDPVTWTVSEYNENSGECILIRGGRRFVDQFSIQQEFEHKPERREVTAQIFDRSPIVRNNVLLRANGRCEWCGQSGFLMTDGGVYLETHHIIPLCEKGPDIETNVTALCPNHHREAHYGKTKEAMRKELTERVRKLSR